MATPLQSTPSASKAIARVKPSHDAMIDVLLCEPGMTAQELASRLGYSGAWVSRIMCSDAFNERLAARKTELLDPVIVSDFNDKLKGICNQSVEILATKLEANQDVTTALKVLDLGAKAGMFGARSQGPLVQNTFVVALPQKAASQEDWASKHGGAVQDAVIKGE